MLEYDRGVPGFSVSSVRSQKATVKASMSGMFSTLEEEVATRSGKDKSYAKHNSAPGQRKKIVIKLFCKIKFWLNCSTSHVGNRFFRFKQETDSKNNTKCSNEKNVLVFESYYFCHSEFQGLFSRTFLASYIYANH